jgi:hypothetical protein
MAKPLDPTVKTILAKHKIDPKEALWDCHGTWVMYHRYIERVAADAGIVFDPPQVLEANGANKSVALSVTGHMADRYEWSIGEAAPGNNKNSYPYAMAEKRAKDRVALKLIGLHGFVYSEDEMPESGNGKAAPNTDAAIAEQLITKIKATRTQQDLFNLKESADFKASFVDLPSADRERVGAAGLERRTYFESMKGRAA